MALQALPLPRLSLANSAHLELDSSSIARLAAPIPASNFSTCGGSLINDRAAHFQLRASSLSMQRPSTEGDWNTRMLFGEGAASSGRVAEVDKDSFWLTLESAGDKLVVLDLYTRWCGPCRLIYPKLVKLSDKYADVIFVKLHCVPENKPLTSKLGVGILPTFKIFKNKDLVSEVKGAKLEELVQKIEKARSG